MIQPEKSELQNMIEVGAMWLVLIIVISYFAISMGVVTFDDKPTPAENITPEVTEEIIENVTEAPVVMVTEDPVLYMLRTNGLPMREFYHWFRADVQGINSQGTKDLSTYATVYDYRFLDSYRWWSVSWYRKFVVKPDDRNDQFLFFFVNMYSDDRGDGLGDDVRQYGHQCNDFSAQVEDRVYYTEWIEYPERRITEFDNMYNFAHVETPGPYGYKIVQEKGTGIITAQSLEWLMGGRSNAWDGWCMVEVPRKDSQGNPVNATNTKILGNFGTFGQAWWQLK